jgi:hypothetical protein
MEEIYAAVSPATGRWANSFPEHFCDDENENGAANPSSEKEIYEGVANSGE